MILKLAEIRNVARSMKQRLEAVSPLLGVSGRWGEGTLRGIWSEQRSQIFQLPNSYSI